MNRLDSGVGRVFFFIEELRLAFVFFFSFIIFLNRGEWSRCIFFGLGFWLFYFLVSVLNIRKLFCIVSGRVFRIFEYGGGKERVYLFTYLFFNFL